MDNKVYKEHIKVTASMCVAALSDKIDKETYISNLGMMLELLIGDDTKEKPNENEDYKKGIMSKLIEHIRLTSDIKKLKQKIKDTVIFAESVLNTLKKTKVYEAVNFDARSQLEAFIKEQKELLK